MAVSSMRIATAVCALAGLMWLAAAASAAGPDDLVVGTTPLDSAETPNPSDSVDELVPDQPTDTPDDLVEGTTSVDALVDEGTTALDPIDTGHTYTESQVQAAGHWEPTPCDLLVVPTPQLPLSSDLAAWGRMLHDAEERIGESQARLEKADAIYTRMLNDNQGGMSGSPVVQQRDAARRDYEQALCTLPKLQEAARRTGLPPGLIHRSPPASQP
jgi:hypothetical protein